MARSGIIPNFYTSALKHDHNRRQNIQSSFPTFNPWASQVLGYYRLFNQVQHRGLHSQRLPFNTRAYGSLATQTNGGNPHKSAQSGNVGSAVQGYPQPVPNTAYVPATYNPAPFPVWSEPVTTVSESAASECVPPSCQATNQVPWAPNRTEKFSVKGKSECSREFSHSALKCDTS